MLFYLIIVSCIFVFKGPISFNFPGMFHLDLNCVPSALRAPVGAFGSSERSAASQEEARRLGGRQMGTKSKEFPKSKCLRRFFFLVTRFFPKLQPTILRMLWSCLFIPFFDLYITGCFETVQLGSSFFYWGGSRGQCLLTCCKMLHRARPISANGTSKTARTGTLGQPHGTMDQSS